MKAKKATKKKSAVKVKDLKARKNPKGGTLLKPVRITSYQLG